MNTEFYVQDNWRVNRKFTLDAGVRFYYITPTQSEGDQVAAVRVRTCGTRAQAPLLFQPVSTAQGRRALNPLTGEILPAVYIGRLVPELGQLHQRHAGVTTARRSRTRPSRSRRASASPGT